jgi:NAD(P)-dependent dehydrogenase (short-subunit alcohol dehydrogenase family)
MLTWVLANDLRDEPVTANAVNPGYVLTPLTRSATGPLKLLSALTGFAAQTPLDGADTTIWAAASPDLAGVTGTFFSKRHEIRCRFRNPRISRNSAPSSSSNWPTHALSQPAPSTAPRAPAQP